MILQADQVDYEYILKISSLGQTQPWRMQLRKNSTSKITEKEQLKLSNRFACLEVFQNEGGNESDKSRIVSQARESLKGNNKVNIYSAQKSHIYHNYDIFLISGDCKNYEEMESCQEKCSDQKESKH